MRWILLLLLLAALAASPARAGEPVLTITMGGTTAQVSRSELLARRDAATVSVPHDSAYGRPMTYRAVPLRALLAERPPSAADTIAARAMDGFVAQVPRSLIDGAAVPWVAIEEPAHPWPHLPGQSVSAGPFYLIWQHPERGHVSSEQWPYALAGFAEAATPAQRWPGLAVDASEPADAPARRGQAVFAVNCLPCHRLAGSGEGVAGPDLLQPMPAVTYFTAAGLRALIRNPAAVRTWPARRMPGFAADVVSDADIDAVIAYLRAQAARRSAPRAAPDQAGPADTEKPPDQTLR